TLAPDPRFFFHSRAHDAVSQQLLTAIRERAGLVVITGEAGAGKTTVCRVVLEEIDRRTLTSFISDASLSAEALLTALLCDFGVLEASHGPLGTRQELSDTLHSFVDSLTTLDAATLVIIDDAQDLADDALEQVRLLCEAAAATSRLQVVLV